MLSLIVLCAVFYLTNGKALLQSFEEPPGYPGIDGYNMNDGMDFLSSYYQDQHFQDAYSNSASRPKNNFEQYTPLFNGKPIVIPPPDMVANTQEKPNNYDGIAIYTKDKTKPSKYQNKIPLEETYESPMIVGGKNDGNPSKSAYNENSGLTNDPAGNKGKFHDDEDDAQVISEFTKTKPGKPELDDYENVPLPESSHEDIDYSKPAVVEKPLKIHNDPIVVELSKNKAKPSTLDYGSQFEDYETPVINGGKSKEKPNKSEYNYEQLSSMETLTKNKENDEDYDDVSVIDALTKIKSGKPEKDDYKKAKIPVQTESGKKAEKPKHNVKQNAYGSPSEDYETPTIVDKGKPNKSHYNYDQLASVETLTKDEDYDDVSVIDALTKIKSSKPKKDDDKKIPVPVDSSYKKSKIKVKPTAPDNQYTSLPLEVQTNDKSKDKFPVGENYDILVTETSPIKDKSSEPKSNYEKVKVSDKSKGHKTTSTIKTDTKINKNSEEYYESPLVVEVLSKNKAKPIKSSGHDYESPVVIEVLKNQKAYKTEAIKNKDKSTDDYNSVAINVETVQDKDHAKSDDVKYKTHRTGTLNFNAERSKISDEKHSESPVALTSVKKQKPEKSDKSEYYERPAMVESLTKKEKPDKSTNYQNPNVAESFTKNKPEIVDGEYAEKSTAGKNEVKVKKPKIPEYLENPQFSKDGTKNKENNKSPSNEYIPDKTKLSSNQVSDGDATDLHVWTTDEDSKFSECLAQSDPELKNLCGENEKLSVKDKTTEAYKDVSSSAQFLSRSFVSSLDSGLWSLLPNSKPPNRRKFKQCSTRKNETGNCMPVQFCSSLNTAGNLEELFANVCIIDDMFLGVCCPAFPVERVAVEWDDAEELQSDDTDQFNTSQECGEISRDAKRKGAWPWMAPLISVSTGKMFCGGALINEKYILTAAHCTTKIPRNQILIRLGQRDSNDHRSAVDFKVVEIKRHAGYNPRTLENDIALLKLSRRVPLGQFKGIVCLPQEDTEADYSDQKAVLIGWNGFFNEKARKTEFLTVMSQKACAEKLGFSVPDSTLCTEAREEDERTCNVDSGAPLIINPDDEDYKVIGVLSWNRNDCDQKFPSTFTRVSHYRGWIKQHAS